MQVLSPLVAAAIAAGAVSYAAAQVATPQAQPPEAAALPHPVHCTLAKAMICKADSGCQPSDMLGKVKLPARMLIHFEHRLIAMTDAEGEPNVSMISALALSGESLILQGVEGKTGWLIHVTTNDDDVSFTVASHHTALTAFGTCEAAD